MDRASKIKNALTMWLCALIVTLSLGETRAENFFATPSLELEQNQPQTQASTREITFAYGYDASDYAIAPKNTVIGHLGTKPNYVDVAKEVGANYLVPSKNWNFKKQGEFIQGVINRGDNVYIGTPIRPGPSILKKEIKQLIKAGYEPVEQGSKVLIKR